MTQAVQGHSSPASHKDYDDVPFSGNAFVQTHPSQLAAVARICGLQPPSPDNCRVLELGCAIGSNLIPMAEGLPGSEFLGIDLSKRHIQVGQATLAELNLKNIRLMHMNLTDVDERLGKFDYIIAHGVYTWVPRSVQNALLDLGRRQLNENGVMYVSYNTYPGWHLREPVRDMMRYHVANLRTPQEKIRQARELIKFIAQSTKTGVEVYPKLLYQVVEMLNEESDSYLYHEYLGEVNVPLYFYEFVARLQAAGLMYVADADLRTMASHFFDDGVTDFLRNLHVLQRQQYLDFCCSRMFRSSLVTHSECEPQVRANSNGLQQLHVGLESGVELESESGGNSTWRHPNGTITTSSPITEVIELLNSRWPSWLSINEICETMLSSRHQSKCFNELIAAMIQGIVRFAEKPPQICHAISQRPACTPYARLQAKKRDNIANRLHFEVRAEQISRLIVEHADGTRTMDDLAGILEKLATNGSFMVMNHSGQVEAPERIDWCSVVRQELSFLAGSSLLVS